MSGKLPPIKPEDILNVAYNLGKNAGSMITQGANAVGGAIGKQKIGIANTPFQTTISNADRVLNTGLQGDPNAQADPFFQGKLQNINDTSMAAMTPIMLAMGEPVAGAERDQAVIEKNATKAETVGMKTKAEIQAEKQKGTLPVINSSPKENLSPIQSQNVILDSKGNPIVNNQTPKYAGEATSPISSGGEKFNTTQTKTTSATPRPEPVRTYKFTNPQKVDTIENQQRNLTIDGHDIKSPAEQDQVNATLNGYGIRGSQRGQLAAVDSKITDLTKEAQATAQASGGFIDKEALLTNITKNLQNNASKHNIPEGEAQIVANNYVDKVYARATGGNLSGDITGITPAKIPTSIALKMKSDMGSDASSTFNQPDPTKWSKDQVTSRYARDAMDTQIDTGNSDIARLNNDTSDLFKARESLRKGAIKEGNVAQEIAGKPKLTIMQKGRLAMDEAIVAGGLSYVVNQGLGAVGTSLPELGRGVVTSAKNFIQQRTNNSVPSSQPGTQNYYSPTNDKNYYSNQTHITADSIPRTIGEVKPDAYGNYPVANPQNVFDQSNNPVAMDRGTYYAKQQQYKTIINNYENGLGGTPQNYSNAKTALDVLNNRWDSQGEINDNYKNIAEVSSLTAKIKGEAKGLSDGLLNSTTFDKLSSIDNGRYKQLKTDIEDLAKAHGVSADKIWGQTTVNALNGVLDSIGQNNANKWNMYLNQQTGNTGPSNLSNTQLPASYQAPTSAPTGVLPKIQMYQPPATPQSGGTLPPISK